MFHTTLEASPEPPNRICLSGNPTRYGTLLDECPHWTIEEQSSEQTCNHQFESVVSDNQDSQISGALESKPERNMISMRWNLHSASSAVCVNLIAALKNFTTCFRHQYKFWDQFIARVMFWRLDNATYPLQEAETKAVWGWLQLQKYRMIAPQCRRTWRVWLQRTDRRSSLGLCQENPTVLDLSQSEPTFYTIDRY